MSASRASGFPEFGLHRPRFWRNKLKSPSSLAIRRNVTISSIFPLTQGSVTESIVLPPRPKAVDMPNTKFIIREWLVPPILLPIFFALLVAAVALIR
jgi:hypothetical protein